jgi:hypothetical protein
MPGVKGAGGPPPKRDAERRRANEPALGAATVAEGATEVPVPEADPEWHQVARMWFESLAGSGQSVFYEPSDWATAYLIAEAISRELGSQPVVVGSGKDATVEMHKLPPKGASLAAWLKAMTSLMVTEGDRRRLRLELERPTVAEDEGGASVSELDLYRQRIPAG